MSCHFALLHGNLSWLSFSAPSLSSGPYRVVSASSAGYLASGPPSGYHNSLQSTGILIPMVSMVFFSSTVLAFITAGSRLAKKWQSAATQAQSCEDGNWRVGRGLVRRNSSLAWGVAWSGELVCVSLGLVDSGLASWLLGEVSGDSSDGIDLQKALFFRCVSNLRNGLWHLGQVFLQFFLDLFCRVLWERY